MLDLPVNCYQTFDFTSDRKRMSVLVILENGDVNDLNIISSDSHVMLICKGADDVIITRLDLQHPHNRHYALSQQGIYQ